MWNSAWYDKRYVEHNAERGIVELKSIGSRKPEQSKRQWRNLTQQSWDESNAGQSVSAGRFSGREQHFAAFVSNEP